MACRRLHAGELFVNRFDMFEVQANYLETGPGAACFPTPARGYPTTVERRIGLPWPTRPWHRGRANNDLLAANFIDDGRTVSIIDYEILGQQRSLLRARQHLERVPPDARPAGGSSSPGQRRTSSKGHLARARLWGLMSQYGWTLWASIQDASSCDRLRLLELGD